MAAVTSEPSARVVTLRGGPLDGLRRHVLRGARRAWFMEPMSSRRHEYRQDTGDPSSWRHAEDAEPGRSVLVTPRTVVAVRADTRWRQDPVALRAALVAELGAATAASIWRAAVEAEQAGDGDER